LALSRKSQCKQKDHVTCSRKRNNYDDSSSEADDFDYVISESRDALSFTRSAVNSPQHVAAVVRNVTYPCSRSCCELKRNYLFTFNVPYTTLKPRFSFSKGGHRSTRSNGAGQSRAITHGACALYIYSNMLQLILVLCSNATEWPAGSLV